MSQPSIADLIHGALSPFRAASQDSADAKAELDTAREAEGGQRVQLMTRLAHLSMTGSWNPKDIDKAVKAVAERENDKRAAKTIQTLMGEVKAAMHPTVRAHVSSFITLSEDAWAYESERKAADKDTPLPIREHFKRQYHLLVKSMRLAVDGTMLDTVEALTAHATAALEEAKADPDAALKVVTRLRDELGTLLASFPEEDLQSAFQTLNAVTVASLRASRGELRLPVAPIVAAPAPTVVLAEPKVIDDGLDVAEGVSNILDDVLEGA